MPVISVLRKQKPRIVSNSENLVDIVSSRPDRARW